MLKETNIWNITKVLSVIGIILASYLFYNFLAYNVFSLTPFEVCNISSTINCKATTSGSLATLFGIPVSLVGLIGYFTILYSAFTKNKKLLLGMTTFGMVFCLRLTYLEIFDIKIICPVCIVCQLIMLTVFLFALYLNFSKPAKSTE